MPASALRSFMRVASPVIPKKANLPVLGYIHVGAGRLAATDLDIGIALTCPEADGPLVCLEAHAVNQFLKTLDRHATNVALCIDGATVTLDRIKVPMLPGEEAPQVPEQGQHTDWQPLDALAVAQFASALTHASTDETRYVLNSVFFDAKAGRIIATDGRRLFKSRQFHWRQLKTSFILPTSPVYPHLAKIVPWDIRIASETRVCIRAGAFTVFSKIVDANYPNYSQVIPTKPSLNRITLPPDFEHTLAQARVGQKPEVAVVMKFEPKNGSSIACQGPEATIIPFEPEISGPGGIVGINPKYLLDAMRAVGHTFEFADGLGPSVFIDRADKNSEMSVVMPVRVA